MNHTTPFLSKSQQICSLLLDLVAPSYGPAGKNVMIITNVGRMLITNSGKTILKHVTVDHPIARYIISSFLSFHERYGDGCVSLIISLHSSISGVCKRIKALTEQIQLSHALVHIRNHFFYSSSFISHMLHCAQKTQANSREEIKDKMKGLVHTLFEGKFGPIASYHLSLSVINWIFSHHSSSSSSLIAQIVTELITYSPVVTFTNRNVNETEIWNGFVIARSSVGAKLHSTSPLPVDFVILDEDFGRDPNREESNVPMLSVGSTSDYMLSLSFETDKIRNFLQRMVKEKIKVILCSGSVSDKAIGLAVEYNIFIIPYLGQEDMDRICKRAKRHPIYNFGPNVFDSDGFRESHVGTFGEIRELAHAGKGYVHVALLNDFDSHTLALNGPSEGLCEQYSEMIDRSLLLIRSWLLWQPPNINDLVDHPDFGGFNKFKKEKREKEANDCLYSFPGGGAIEIELYSIFRKMEIETKQESMWIALGFDILAKGVVSLPSRLTQKFSFANRSFLKELLKLQKSHDEGCHNQGFIVTSFSRKKFELEQLPEMIEYTGDTLSENIVHPMGLKYL